MNSQTDLLRKCKFRHATIRKLPYKDKHRYNQRPQQENLQKSQTQQHQKQKPTQVERKRMYIYIERYIDIDIMRNVSH